MSEALSILSDSSNALPVYIIPALTKDHAEALATRTATLVITNADEFKAAAADLNQLTKDFNVIDTKRLELGREYDRLKEENVTKLAKPLLDALKASKSNVQAQMEAWQTKENARLAAIEEEKRQQAAKAEALRVEAERRQTVAADKVEAATDEEQFVEAGYAFDRGLAVAGQAQEMEQAAQSVPIPTALKPRGVAMKDEVKSLKVTDLAALPLTYHMADEDKIKKHILDGTLSSSTPGIQFTVGPKIRATGR